MLNFRRVPFVTIIIALLTTAIYLLSLLNRDAMWANLSADWTLLYRQPWRIVTSPFLHHDFFQFLNNLVFLCLFGWQIEPRFGAIKTLGIFLGALVTSHVLTITFTHDWIVGISLGICGLFGFSLIANRRAPFWTTLTHRPLHALYLVTLITPLIPFVANMLDFRVSHMSHLGGILYGVAFGVVFLLLPHHTRWRGAIIALPFLLFASQFYSPWQMEWRIVKKPPILVTSTADCRLRSMEQEVYTLALITFENHSTKQIALYWLDYEGKPEFYFWLGSGDSREQQTFIGHPWCIVAIDSGEALQAVRVTETQHIITIR
jgi:membrane associated rhomboid family serine protease